MLQSTARMLRATARGARGGANLVEAMGAARAIKRTAPDEPTAAYSYIETFEYGEISGAPVQIRSEFVQLLEIVEAERPRTILEIGTAFGGTIFLFARAAAEDALLVTVDMGGGPFGGGYPRMRTAFIRALGRSRQRIVPVRGDSHALTTAAAIRRALHERSVDFLFIDGDHRYEGIKADYEMYAPLVRKGGLVAFHDIVPGTLDLVGGVPQFWEELRDAHDGCVTELVENWEQGGFGIGIVRRA